MKDPNIQSLIKCIVKQVLKEYVSNVERQAAEDLAATSGINNATTTSLDTMSPAEQAKARRDAGKAKDDEIKQTNAEFDSEKSQQKMYHDKIKQFDRFTKKRLVTKLQQLKKSAI